MRRHDVNGFVVPSKNTSELCVADANRFFQHGLEYRLKTAGGALRLGAPQTSPSAALRFREVGCAFGEVCGSLTQFVEQPRVLDGDDGLSGEVLD